MRDRFEATIDARREFHASPALRMQHVTRRQFRGDKVDCRDADRQRRWEDRPFKSRDREQILLALSRGTSTRCAPPAIPLSSRREDQHTCTQKMLHAQHGPSTASNPFPSEQATGPGLFSTRPLR